MVRTNLIAGSLVLIASPALAAAPAAAVGAAADAAPAQQPVQLTPEQRAQAIQELQDLKARIGAIETRLGVIPPSPVQYTPPSKKAASDHNLELYGFVQLDAIQDFNRVNPNWEGALRPSRIPTQDGQFGSNGQSIFSVRQSRLGVKATGMLGNRPYEAKFEFDLFGTGADEGKTTFHVRHMYAKWGPFLAGQTNTLWMDGDIAPNSIEYWGPPGMVWLRNPQLRWTFWDKDGWMAAVALEHPSNDIDTGNVRLIDEDLATNIQPDEKVPDLTAAIGYTGKWGHARLGGILRRVGFDTKGTTDNEPRGHKAGWGLDATTAINISPATLKLGVVYGKGIATYMNDGGMDIAPTASLIPVFPIFPPPPLPLFELVDSKTVPLLGISAFVDFQWAKDWTSSIGYSMTRVDNTNFQAPEAFHKGEYALANILWTPFDPVMTGLELQWGSRTDNDGQKGHDFRVQYSFKWSFSSKNLWDLVE